MLAQICKQWFWDCYDHMGRLIVANIILFTLLFGAVMYVLPLVAALLTNLTPSQGALLLFLVVVFGGPIWLSIWFVPYGHFGALVAEEKDPGFVEFLRAFRLRGLRTWAYFQILCLAAGVLLMNMWFYFRWETESGAARLFFNVLAGLCFWMVMLLVLTAMAGIPLVARRSTPLRGVFRESLLVVVKHPLTILGAFAFLASLWFLGSVPLKMGGVLVFGMSGTAMMLNSICDVTLELERRQAEAAEATGDSRPRTWREVKVQEKESEKERLEKSRYERTFRDILRPWEM